MNSLVSHRCRIYPGQRQGCLAHVTANDLCSFSKLVRYCTSQSRFVPGCPFLYLNSSNFCRTSLRKQRVRRRFLLALALRFGLLRKFSMDENLENIRLLTLSEAANLLQVSTRTLQRMIRNGELPAFKVGGQWRLRETQLRQWVENRESTLVKLEKESRDI